MASNFVWDGRVGRYRWKSNGRFLSRNTMSHLVRGRIESARSSFLNSFDQLKSGEIDFQQFQAQGRDFIRTFHTQGMMLGAGGYDQTDPEDFLEIARFLKNEEYVRWRWFMEQIADGQLSDAQIKARMKLYGANIRQSVEKGQQKAAERANYQYERRFLGDCAPHCKECRRYANQGASRIGELPVPGQRCSCGPNCCCSKRFYQTLEEAMLSS